MTASRSDNSGSLRVSRRNFLRASIAMAGATYLAACGGSPEAPASAPATNDAAGDPAASAPASGPKQGGQVIVDFGLPPTLNPAITAVSTAIYTTQLFFNGLTRPDDNAEPSPDLAESWDISEDSLTYTFKLRQGVKFHDGQPLTAKDVSFTWHIICHPENTQARQLAGYFNRVKGAADYIAGNASTIEGITVVDDYTIKAELTEVYAPFLSISAGQFIIPEHIWKDVPMAEFGSHPAARIPVGTGPFIAESWTTNDSIVANANPDYFEGRPHLDKVIIRDYTADKSAIYNLLKSGEMNVMGLYGSVPIDNIADAQADENLEVRSLTGFTNEYVEFNFNSQFFSDERVRKALSYAVNRSVLTDGLWLGHAQQLNSPIHPVFWASKPDTTTFDNNVEEAKRLLDEAGWIVGPNGVRVKDGVEFRFKFPTIAADYSLVLQQQWREIGVEIEIEFMDFGSFWGPIYLAKTFDAAGLNLPFGLYLDPDFPLNGYFNSKLNRNSYKNERVDELIGLATSTLDNAERKKYYDEFQELLAQDVPHLWLGIKNDTWAYTKGLVIPEKKTGYLTYRAIKDWYWNN